MNLGDVLQIYEFGKSFAKPLNLRSRYSVEQLYTSLNQQNDDIYSLASQYVVGIIDKFCVHYLVETQNTTNSSFLNIIGQMKNEFTRKSALFLLWPQVFTLIVRVYRVRNYIKDETETEYTQLKDRLLEMPFPQWSGKDKVELLMFLINSVCYESDFIINEISEGEKLIEQLQDKNWRKELIKKEANLRNLQNESAGTKKQRKHNSKYQTKLEQSIIQAEQDVQLLRKVATMDPNAPFPVRAVEILQNGYYVFQDERRALYRLKQSEWQCSTGQDMLDEVNASPFLGRFKQHGYFQITPCLFDPVIVDRTWNIEQVLGDEMQLEYFQECNMETIRLILLSLERDYSEYELKYWSSCWTSQEKRQLWQERVLSANKEDMLIILNKIPHQLSFVNRKHGKEADPNEKYKSSRLYWFYQNKAYAMPYQQLSKSDATITNMYLLAITLYEKLKVYIHKKMRTMDMNMNEQLPSTQSSKGQEQQMDDQFDDFQD